MGVDPANGSGGTQIIAAPMSFLSDWAVNFTVDKVDVSAMGDLNHTYVAGLPDASGTFSGWFDTATAQTYVAATDGLARNFYLYPSTLAAMIGPPGQYFFGQVLPDYSLAGGSDVAVSLTSTWNAAGRIQRYPVYGLSGT
jgi:hypothetical protein